MRGGGQAPSCPPAPASSLRPPCLCAEQASHRGGPGLADSGEVESLLRVGICCGAALRVVCQAELLASQLAVLTSN